MADLGSLSSYGTSEHRDFMRKARGGLLMRAFRGNGGSQLSGRSAAVRDGTPMYGASSRSPTAAESMAFEEKKKNRALYGKYGKGGLEREKLGSKEKIAGIGKDSAMGVAGIRAGAQTGAAGIRADASRDVAGIRARSDLGVQKSRNVGAIDERKLMEGGQDKRLGKTLGAKRETDLLRFGKGGLEERKLNILEKTKTLPKIHTLDRPDMMGQDAFTTVQNPETGAWELQKLNQTSDVPRGITPEQEKKKKKMFDAMSPEERAYWLNMVK